jgi:hypothetical protein
MITVYIVTGETAGKALLAAFATLEEAEWYVAKEKEVTETWGNETRPRYFQAEIYPMTISPGNPVILWE